MLETLRATSQCAHWVNGSILVAIAAIVSWTVGESRGKPRFEEIDVERINIVEADGSLRMVISNKARQHPGSVDGRSIPRQHARPPGILFFNHLGDEAGGLVMDGNGAPDGFGHFISLTMDKSRNDQTIAIQHLESDSGAFEAGLRLVDRPDISLHETIEHYRRLDALEGDPDAQDALFRELAEQGVFGERRASLARLRDASVGLTLHDTKGRVRIRLQVGADGEPRIEVLDEEGVVIASLPE